MKKLTRDEVRKMRRRLLSQGELVARVGIREFALWQRIKRGEFPAAVGRAAAGRGSPHYWSKRAVDRWVRDHAAEFDRARARAAAAEKSWRRRKAELARLRAMAKRAR
jgi:predicted DNA-binding transcriptional regulator AlpA